MNTTVVFWDVQHGHAAYISSPNKKHIVVDLGTGTYGANNATFSPLQYLRSQGVHKLHYVVVTHPHKDHIDDILNFDAFNPSIFCRPNHLTPNDIMKNVRHQDRALYEKYLEINTRYSADAASNPDNPYHKENYGGLVIKSFVPKACPRTNINNHSVVMVFWYSGFKVVIPGDNELCSFRELMAQVDFQNAARNADILLAPHHGRESGFDTDFVDLVSPRLTVISDGRFVDTSATSRYSAKTIGCKVHRRNSGLVDRKCVTTRNDGVVMVEIGNNGMSVVID